MVIAMQLVLACSNIFLRLNPGDWVAKGAALGSAGLSLTPKAREFDLNSLTPRAELVLDHDHLPRLLTNSIERSDH